MKRAFTTSEIAEFCQVSPATIFRAINSKALKAFTTPGGHFRVTQEDLEAFLKANNVPFRIPSSLVKRILIVEDNPVELRLFKRALASEPNYEIEATSSGYNAGFLTKSFQPDLILLDLNLPDIDGLEVVRLIRSDPCLKNAKVIGISGAKKLKKAAAREMGFDDFIPKPVTPSALREKIRECLA